MASLSESRNANTKASTCAQQQAQVSVQAQDTSPPVYQQVVPPEDEHPSVAPQSTGTQQGNKHIPISIICLLLAMGVDWVLNSTGMIKGLWANIIAAMFAMLVGIGPLIIPLIKLLFQPTTSVKLSPSPLNSQPLTSRSEDSSIPRPKGQLVIHADKSLQGSTVDLYLGFRNLRKIRAASNIVECKTEEGHTCYRAEFPSLLPGPYTARNQRRELTARVTIYAGKETRIDWLNV